MKLHRKNIRSSTFPHVMRNIKPSIHSPLRKYKGFAYFCESSRLLVKSMTWHSGKYTSARPPRCIKARLRTGRNRKYPLGQGVTNKYTRQVGSVTRTPPTSTWLVEDKGTPRVVAEEQTRMKSRGSQEPCSSRQGTTQPPSYHSAFYRLFAYNA